MSEEAAAFVKRWIADNIKNDPAFDGDLDARADDAIARLRADAVSEGIAESDADLDASVLYGALTQAIEETAVPAAGSPKDSYASANSQPVLRGLKAAVAAGCPRGGVHCQEVA